MRRPASPVRTDIVLVGGGHAHVEVLRRFAMAPEPGVRLTVIARDVETPYSGMVPGYVAGHYTRAECHIDLRPLAIGAGARLYEGAATGLDPVRKTVRVEGRPPVSYDFLSIDTGSVPDAPAIAGAAENAVPVKPIDGLLEAVAGLERALEAGREPMRIAVIGAGAGGVELTLALHHRLSVLAGERGAAAPRFIIIEKAADIMPGHASGARRGLARALAGRGIEVRPGAPVAAFEPGGVTLEDGSGIKCDRAILVSGASPARWIAESGIATDARGFIEVDRTLRSLSHRDILAAGDVASFAGRDLPKSGVYAVRAGPILARNLRALAQGRAPRPFRPQRSALALISTGPKHAVASRGPFSLSGRFMWRLKDRIDRRFMEKYAGLAGTGMGAADAGADPFAEMRCAGCGAKIDRAVLSRVLARLGRNARGSLLLSSEPGDDAAILAPPPPGEVAVQTVDQFRAFIDDPHLLGRITANHCLGDLHAMGARPHAALAMVMLPDADPRRLEDDLVQLLTGACEVLSAAGATLVGGHTGEAAELVFGLALTGHGEEERLLRRSGLRDGDRLILTKPIGTGVLFNADMRGEAPGSAISAALAEMQVSQAGAAGVLMAHGARAACDVTGFGLAGHLAEMLDASGVDAVLDPDAVPVLAGAGELVRRGFESTLAPANRDGARGAIGNVEDPRLALWFDPQTAGGLLAGVPSDRAEACVAALRRAGHGAAAVIGEVVRRAGSVANISPTD
jgi:selenide,water dikinase